MTTARDSTSSDRSLTSENADWTSDHLSPPGVPNIGAILHRLRAQRGWSLRKVADASGLSASFLAAVERGDSDIALQRLARLAHVFEHDVGSFLGYSPRQARPQFASPADYIHLDRGEGTEYEAIRLPGVNFELIVATFQPRTAFRDEISHEGIDIVWVAQGTITLIYSGEEYTMHTGSCALWSGVYPHTFRNDGDDLAQFFAVVTGVVY